MRHHIASHVTMRILLIPSLRQNPRDDLWVLDLETLAWTEVRTLGVPPPPGLGACCLTQTGRDLVVTKDKIAAPGSRAEREAGVPSAMGVWRLRLVRSQADKAVARAVGGGGSKQQAEEAAEQRREHFRRRSSVSAASAMSLNSDQDRGSNVGVGGDKKAAARVTTWEGHWSRAPRRLPPHGAGHSVTTLGRHQIVFGGLASVTTTSNPKSKDGRVDRGDVVTMSLGAVKFVGSLEQDEDGAAADSSSPEAGASTAFSHPEVARSHAASAKNNREGTAFNVARTEEGDDTPEAERRNHRLLRRRFKDNYDDSRYDDSNAKLLEQERMELASHAPRGGGGGGASVKAADEEGEGGELHQRLSPSSPQSPAASFGGAMLLKRFPERLAPGPGAIGTRRALTPDPSRAVKAAAAAVAVAVASEEEIDDLGQQQQPRRRRRRGGRQRHLFNPLRDGVPVNGEGYDGDRSSTSRVLIFGGAATIKEKKDGDEDEVEYDDGFEDGDVEEAAPCGGGFSVRDKSRVAMRRLLRGSPGRKQGREQEVAAVAAATVGGVAGLAPLPPSAVAKQEASREQAQRRDDVFGGDDFDDDFDDDGGGGIGLAGGSALAEWLEMTGAKAEQLKRKKERDLEEGEDEAAAAAGVALVGALTGEPCPEAWRARAWGLRRQFPSAELGHVVDALVANDGHAGRAASVLMDEGHKRVQQPEQERQQQQPPPSLPRHQSMPPHTTTTANTAPQRRSSLRSNSGDARRRRDSAASMSSRSSGYGTDEDGNEDENDGAASNDDQKSLPDLSPRQMRGTGDTDVSSLSAGTARSVTFRKRDAVNNDDYDDDDGGDDGRGGNRKGGGGPFRGHGDDWRAANKRATNAGDSDQQPNSDRVRQLKERLRRQQQENEKKSGGNKAAKSRGGGRKGVTDGGDSLAGGQMLVMHTRPVRAVPTLMRSGLRGNHETGLDDGGGSNGGGGGSGSGSQAGDGNEEEDNDDDDDDDDDDDGDDEVDLPMLSLEASGTASWLRAWAARPESFKKGVPAPPTRQYHAAAAGLNEARSTGNQPVPKAQGGH